MTWPQVVLLVWLMFSGYHAINREVGNRNQSAGWATAGVLLVLAFLCGQAAVLHAGGFW